MVRLFTSLKFNDLTDLLIEQLEDLYDAEKRLADALPKMADAAHDSQLKAAFEQHRVETENHVRRLEEVFAELGRDPERETCDAMKGLIAEGEEMISAKGDPDVKDAALIAAAQRVEHYEIASYGTMRTFALQLGHQRIADILQQTLDEEGQTDKKLTAIAEQGINPRARH
jgi:ferritin-like metal-binding protein YciE